MVTEIKQGTRRNGKVLTTSAAAEGGIKVLYEDTLSGSHVAEIIPSLIVIKSNEIVLPLVVRIDDVMRK